MKKYNNIDEDDLMFLIKNTKLTFDFIKQYILNKDIDISIDVIYCYKYRCDILL
jgi:hypothetical protein